MEPTGNNGLSPLDELQRQLNEDLAQVVAPTPPPLASAPLVATTISTVVVQGGPLQLVIALLKSGERLYIKVADLLPKFTFLGPSLDEALHLQRQHEELLRQIQNLPTPLEEFYHKVQEKIASHERPDPVLIEEMAASLGAVWQDIKKMLQERRDIILLNVTFFERLGECYGKMSSLEVACNDTMIPIEIDAVREFLESFKFLRTEMLSTISAGLKVGNQMLDKLRELANIGTFDSRPNHVKQDALQAVAQVERWLEDLSNRRNNLEQAWQSRKTQLEQCLTLAILAKELSDIEYSLNATKNSNFSSFTLGDSANQARDLLEIYQNVKPEALLLRDKSLKITKTTEELVSTGCFAGDEACAKAYSILACCTEFVDEVDHREALLSQSREFFGRAENLLTKLSQIEIELSNLQLRPSSPSPLLLQNKALQEVTATIEDILQMGYSLIDDVGRTKPEVAGVQAMVERIEQKKASFERYCLQSSEESLRLTEALNDFLERYNQLFQWLEDSRRERIEQAVDIHRMGENLAEAKDCLLLHHQLLNDLEIKGNAINNLLVRLTPVLEYLEDDQRDDVQHKIDVIRQTWIELKNYVNTRVDLLKLYIRFHQEAEILRNLFESFDIQKAAFRSAEHDRPLLQAALDNIRAQLGQLKAFGEQCIDGLEKVADPYLQKARAAQCVDRTLTELNARQLTAADEWERWNAQQHTDATLNDIMAANMETLAAASKLEEQLYPIFNTASDNPADLSAFIATKLSQIQSEIRSAESELTNRFETIDQLDTDGPEGSEKVIQVKNSLNSIKTKLHTIAADFQELASAVDRFLRSVLTCRDNIKDYFANKQPISGPDNVESITNSYEQFKQNTMEYFRNLLQQSEQIIERIKAQEPPGAKEQDTDKIITLLENLRTYFETQTESENSELRKQHAVIAFDRSLNEVRGEIREKLEQVNRGRGQYGENADGARHNLAALDDFERGLTDLESKIESFVSSSQSLSSQYPETAQYVHTEATKIRNEWAELFNTIQEYRKLTTIAIQYYELITVVENNYRNLNADLINANNKLSILNNPDIANDLIQQIDNILKVYETQQLDTLKQISTLSSQIYGHDSSVVLYNDNLKLFQSFYKIKNDLNDRAKELTEQQLQQQQQQETQQNGYHEVTTITSTTSHNGLPQQQSFEVQTVDESQYFQEPQSPLVIQTVEESRHEQIHEIVTATEPPPSLSVPQPLRDVSVREGQRAQLQCVIIGHPTPAIEWFKDGISIHNNPDYKTTFDGGLCTLTIDETVTADTAEYLCRAINDAGIADSPARLIVTELPQPVKPQGVPPVFTQKLENGTATEGQPFQYLCTVSALEPTEYPSFRVPPSNVMARVGQKIKLEAEVAGTPPPEVMWTHDGKHFSNREVKFFYENGRAQLVIDEAFLKDAGVYTLTAKNIAGEKSCSCNVVVKGRLPNETSDSELASDMEPVKPSVQLQLKDVSVFEGKPVRLDCVIVGQPEPEVIWYHGDRPVKESTDFQLLFQGDHCSLVIREAFLEDAGEYRVVAINSAGEASSKCNLIVTPLNIAEPAVRQPTERVLPPLGAPPKFERLLADILAADGEKCQFECAVSGDPRPNVKWFVNNREIEENPRVHSVYRDDGVVKLVIEQVFPDDKGVYTAKASNPSGEAKCFSNLIVKSINATEFESVPAFLSDSVVCPTFKELFADRIVKLHESTKFECIVVGKPQPKIKWFFNDQPVHGHDFLVSTSGDRQVLTIPEISPELAGKITCYAENEAGNAQCVAYVKLADVYGAMLPMQPLITAESMLQVDNSGSSFVTLQKQVTTSSSSYSSSMLVENGVSQSEVHSQSAHMDRSFKQVGDQAPEVAETKQFAQFHQANDQPPSFQQETSMLNIANNNASEMHETIIANSGQISTGKPARRSSAPRFVSPFNGKIVDQGADVVFEGIIDGYPTAEVKVTKNDVELQPDGERITVSYSLNKIVVELKNVSTKDAGRYTATASNAAGASSTTADLVVKKSIFPPVFGRRVQAQSVRRGDRVILDAEISGTPEPIVAWFKDNRPVQEALRQGSYALQQVGPTCKLIFEQIDYPDSGKYMIVARNTGGEAQSIADVVVMEAEQPQPAQQPQKHVSFVEPQPQQPGESVPDESGFIAHQEFSAESKLKGPTTESTIVTETRRTTEATMRMEHKVNFPDLPPVTFSQRTQTPTIPLRSEGSMAQTNVQTSATNTDRIATRTDATQTPIPQPQQQQQQQGKTEATQTPPQVEAPKPPPEELKPETTKRSAFQYFEKITSNGTAESVAVAPPPPVFKPTSFKPLKPPQVASDQTHKLVGEEKLIYNAYTPGQDIRSYQPPAAQVPSEPNRTLESTTTTTSSSSYQSSTHRVDFLSPQGVTVPTPPIYHQEPHQPIIEKHPIPKPDPTPIPLQPMQSSFFSQQQLQQQQQQQLQQQQQQQQQMYSSFTTTHQLQASNLSQQQYSQSMQYQPYKPSEPLPAPQPTMQAPVFTPLPQPTPQPFKPAAPMQTFAPAPAPQPTPQPFKPAAPMQTFAPAPAPAPEPFYAPAPQPFKPAAPLQTFAPAPAPASEPQFIPVHHSLAAATGPTLYSGPSYNQTPQPFKPLPPPSITPSQQNYTSTPLEFPPVQQTFIPAPAPAPVPQFTPAPAPVPMPQFEPAPAPIPQPTLYQEPLYQPHPMQLQLQPEPQFFPQQQQQQPMQQHHSEFVHQQQLQQYHYQQQHMEEEVYKKKSVKETKQLFEQTIQQQDFKSPRMFAQVAAQSPTRPMTLPPDFGYSPAEIGLEPGPQPTMGYAPKLSNERKSSYYREKIEQSLFESMDKVPERVPAGGVKIIPPSPRKKSQTPGQSDTAGMPPASFEQPSEAKGTPTVAPAKSPFTATESECESDLDVTRKMNGVSSGYLADTEEVQKQTMQTVSFSSSSEQKVESFSSSSKTESVVLGSSAEVVQQEEHKVESIEATKVEKVEDAAPTVTAEIAATEVQPEQQQQEPQQQEQQQQEQQQQEQQVSEQVVAETTTTTTTTTSSSSTEEVTKEPIKVQEEGPRNFLANDDLPDDMQPVKVLPTEEPLPTLKHVPVPAAVQPVTEPEHVPLVQELPPQLVVEPAAALPVVTPQQNGYPSASEYGNDFDQKITPAWQPTQTDVGYKSVHPVFNAPKPHETGPAAPPPSVFDPIDKVQTTTLQQPQQFIDRIEKPKPISYTQSTTTQQQQSESSSFQSYQQQSFQQQQEQQHHVSFPPVETAPALYYTSVTAQPVHSTIASETSNTMHMKETTETSNRVVNMSQSQQVVNLESANQFMAQNAGRFTPGEYRESDYESDGSRIRPLWTPHPSDSDEPHFRSVRPQFKQPRSASVPRSGEHIQTPMEFDTGPVLMPSKIVTTVESTNQQQSQTVETVEVLQTQTLDRKSSFSSKRLATSHVSNLRDDMAVKAHKVAPINYIQKATNQAESMSQSFKTKAYHFTNEVMTDMRKAPIKPILKNAFGYQVPVVQAAPPAPTATTPTPTADSNAQAYREESRVSQYGTKHVDPDTGIIYFKYDFGYEFGIIFPGEGHRIIAGASRNRNQKLLTNGAGGDRQKHPLYQSASPFGRSGATSVEVPVIHERTKDYYRNCSPTPFRRSASVPAPDMQASRYQQRYNYPVPAGTGTQQGGSGRSTPRVGYFRPLSRCTTPDQQSTPVQGYNRSATCTPKPHPQEPAIATKLPLFVAPLKDIAVVSGQPARFECIVACDATPAIRWTKNNVPIDESGQRYYPEYRNGLCRLSLPVAYEGDAGNYSCLAENHLGHNQTCADLIVIDSDWRTASVVTDF
ncbi:titin isoform X2 [Ochlerotatus camptorhynchus]|uniref:titin isoform X2 n=1 Tax=Ochlerotatus camptorhynchus TaxID=644619 RepID=UPI0031CEF464